MLSTPSVILMAGTRDAHVAMLRPLARKMAKTAVRQRTSCDRVRTSSMPANLPNRARLVESIRRAESIDSRTEVASIRHEHAPGHHHRRRPHAGVSPSTASVVFSGKTAVSDATRQRVLDAAGALGYTGPDPRAASLRRGRSGIVGVVFEEHLGAAFLDPVKTLMMDGLADGVASLGAGLLLLRDQAPPGTGADAHHRAAGCRRARRLQRAAARIARRRHGTRHPGRGHRGRRRRGHPADRARQPRGAAAGCQPPARARSRACRRSSRSLSVRAGSAAGSPTTSRSRSTSPANGSPARATCSGMPRRTARRPASIDEGLAAGRVLFADATAAADRGHRTERPARRRCDPRGGRGGSASARRRERHGIRRNRRGRPRALRADDTGAARGRQGTSRGACRGGDARGGDRSIHSVHVRLPRRQHHRTPRLSTACRRSRAEGGHPARR